MLAQKCYCCANGDVVGEEEGMNVQVWVALEAVRSKKYKGLIHMVLGIYVRTKRKNNE